MILSKLTVKPLLWLAGAQLAIILSLVAALYLQSAAHDRAMVGVERERDRAITRANGLQHQLDAATTRAIELNTALSGKDVTIDDLAGRLNAMVKETKGLQAMVIRLHDKLKSAQRERDAARAQLHTYRETLYATDAECADWARRPVCGALSHSLLQQWTEAADAAGADHRTPDRGGEAAPGGGGSGTDRGATPASGAGAGSASGAGLLPPPRVLFWPPA